jgi:apolipoprotein N-acyltransferase
VAALLLWLANPPADLGPMAFVALVPLLWAIRGQRARRGAALAFAFGLIYYGVLLWWLTPFGLIAWLPLVVVEAAYLLAFGALVPILWRDRHPVQSVAGVAALWTILDWVRATWPIGGFTWGALGNTQHGNGLTLPLASVTGVWGVTFVVVAVNALLFLLVGRSGWGRRTALAAGAAALILLPAAIPLPAATGRPLDVAVVQGNVPLALAHDRLLQSEVVGENHIRLNARLAADPPDLAVWPENALATDPTRDPALGAAVSGSIRRVGSPTLVGAIQEQADGRFANQVLYYSGTGQVLGRYVKEHLVPFGEYIPYPSVFGWTQRYRQGNADLVPGHTRVLFRVDGIPVAAPICFENIFPGLIRRFVADGARLVVVSTNDSSFLYSPASREHVIMSQLRAVETGRWVVHGAISGESAIIDPHGRVVDRTGLFTATILRARVPTSTARTLYVRFGDWFPWACGLLVGGLVAATALRRRRTRRDPAEVRTPPAGEQAVSAPVRGAEEPRVLVVLPTYNERATIPAVIGGIRERAPGADILVVDDSSPDGTGEVVRSLAKGDPHVRLRSRAAKQGLAAAYLDGFRQALEEGYDVVVEMDSDLSHRPEDLPRILAGAGTHDLTIGSRYVPGGAVTNWSRGRLALSRAGNRYARTVLGLPVADATSGFRAYRAPLLRELLADGITADGYAFQIELAYRAWRAGWDVAEVPILFREREEGASKMSRRIVGEALVKVSGWAWRDRVRGSRSRRPTA